MTGAGRLLSLRGLAAGYATTPVLQDVSLEVEPGEWVAVVGPNGSGKSTLLACISGRLAATAGRVLIDGVDMAGEPERAKRGLGYAVTPDSLPADLTGRQCLDVFAMARQMPGIDPTTAELAAALKLADYLDQPVRTYSLGTRQKLAVVLAALGSPPLLVLDEVFSGLDPASAWTLKSHLEARVDSATSSVLLATHDLGTVESHCTSVHLLIDGRLCRTWNRAELDGVRGRPGRLERLLANAMAGDSEV